MTCYEKDPVCNDSSKNTHMGQGFFLLSLHICFVFHFWALLFGH